MKSLFLSLAWAHPRPLLTRLALALWGGFVAVSAGAADTSLFGTSIERNIGPELTLVQDFYTQAGDRSVAALLERWTRQVGVGLVWDAKTDVTLTGQDRFTGTLEQAVERLLSGITGVSLQACVHTNTPPVIRITESGTKCD
jgi:hypothetical protein